MNFRCASAQNHHVLAGYWRHVVYPFGMAALHMMALGYPLRTGELALDICAGRLRSQPLVDTGFICVSPGVLVHLVSHGVTAEPQLKRHACGDWGIVPSEDAMVSWLAVQYEARIMSIYDISGKRVWIITEADRSVTTLLFPEEY